MFEFFEVKYKKIIYIPKLIIKPGFTALFGPSGSGKTTILKMLNKMISPTTGSIIFNGIDLKQIRSVEHRRNAILLSQSPVVFEGTIKDNLNIGFKFQGKTSPDDRTLSEMLAQVQLKKDLYELANQLSGGEKQRLALGRLLLFDPTVYLLDEPAASLDDNSEDIIIKMVSEQVKISEKSVIMVTHSRTVAEKYADEIIELTDGKIKNSGVLYAGDN